MVEICKNIGIQNSYKKKQKDNPCLTLYRKTYQKKFMEVSRSDGNKKLKKEIFEKEQIKEVNYTINNNSIQLQERIISYPSHFLKINLSSSPKRI